METKERIIVALDVDTLGKALGLVEKLHPYVGYFKVGLELLTSEGAPKVVQGIKEAGGKIFYDGKFKDIPNTVAGAARAVTRLGVQMFNVHCLGGPAMMKKAREAAEEEAKLLGVSRPLVLGVTVLTSLDYQDLVKMRIMSPADTTVPKEIAEAGKTDKIQKFVHNLALLAKESGLDGVIASPQEVRTICGYGVPRDYPRLPLDFLVVTPGVRPFWAAAGDQKRVMTPGEAIKAGADYLVIGRPITQPPKEIGGPVEAAKKIVEEIEAVRR
jgi:orotidine-5'-phosphate decarboxylase